ncbi:MAG: hypothetical protein KF784_12650 [Fimbriimonadaceae bacterium]|nr:hypothetical protein [Fimbriimonadaceae bacterium]
MRNPTSLSSLIHEGMHPTLSGLKNPENEAHGWLCKTIQTLDQRGLGKLVDRLLAQMSSLTKVQGDLLEVSLAERLCRSFPEAKIEYEPPPCPPATSPPDLVVWQGTARINFQCKAVLNLSNELWLERFLSWCEKKYCEREPGLVLDIAVERDLDEEAFERLKRWFSQNIDQLPVGLHVDWLDASTNCYVQITLTNQEKKGVKRGTTWAPVDTLGFAQEVREDDLRDSLSTRFKKAKPSFAPKASSDQLNIIVIELPMLSLFEEDCLWQALYGSAVFKADPSGVGWTTAGNGYFGVQNAWCSALILATRSPEKPFVVFPHPTHSETLKLFLETGPDFRLGQRYED